MLAMSQSGIIANNIIENQKEQIIPVKPIKMSSVVLPKRIMKVPSNAPSQRLQLRPLTVKAESEGPQTIRLKRPSSISSSLGNLEGNSKKLKPLMNNNNLAEFGLKGPVLSQIFRGTFDTSVAFNVQVCSIVSCRVVSSAPVFPTLVSR